MRTLKMLKLGTQASYFFVLVFIPDIPLNIPPKNCIVKSANRKKPVVSSPYVNPFRTEAVGVVDAIVVEATFRYTRVTEVNTESLPVFTKLRLP